MMIWQLAAFATILIGVASVPHAGKPSFAPYHGGMFLMWAIMILSLLLADQLPTI